MGLRFTVELWDDQRLHVERILCALGNQLEAKAVFERAALEYPDRVLVLCLGARIIEQRNWRD